MTHLASRLLVAPRLIPVTLVVIFSAPAWITWPFLSRERRTSVLDMVKALTQWTNAEIATPPTAQPDSLSS